MIDTEHLEYIIEEIKEDINRPYMLSNEELADEMFPYLKKEFPTIKLFKLGITQWFVVTPIATSTLKERLTKKIEDHNNEIIELQNLIDELSDNVLDVRDKLTRNMVVEGSSDWIRAEQYKNYHSIYNSRLGSIKEVWRDKDEYLCVQYVSGAGELLDWFHYKLQNNELTWW